MLLIALDIWVATGRPILFREPRIGYGGRMFTIYQVPHDERWAG